MSLFESPWQAIQTKILKQWIDSAKTQKLFDASFFDFFFMAQSISQLIIIHLNGWYCAHFLPPRRNFRKHNALSNKVRSRCCKFSIFGIFWAACMKNQSEIQVSCAQGFATYMRQIFDKTYRIVKIYLINFFMAKTNMFGIFFHRKNDQIWDPWQNWLIITFFAGKRCAGVCLCPKGLISAKIFDLALTVLEIFAKNHF